ncbi:MAG: hypothetical protein Q8Q50_10150 [Methylobacter sp.]|nr:hypothetical protein [Methylobacter sp.]
MTTNLQDIFASLYRFTAMYDKDQQAMTNWWYTNAAMDIARVFKNLEGNKIIVNCKNLKNWEYAADKLLLIADAVAIRDIRPFETKIGFIIHPNWKPYDRSSLDNLPLPPIGRLLTMEPGYLNGDLVDIPLVGKTPSSMSVYEGFPDDAYEWIHGAGKRYHKTGSIFYAPFIPALEVELEFMKNRVSVANLLGGESLYTESIDFVDENSLMALASLKLPTLENVSLETLNKIKYDHIEDFTSFSRSILKATTAIKSAAGAELFAKEVRAIQRDLIDDNLDKLDKKYRQISKMRTLSSSGVFVGVVGLSFAAIEGAALPAITTGLASAITAGIAYAAAQIKEKYTQEENPMHFLWRLHRSS